MKNFLLSQRKKGDIHKPLLKKENRNINDIFSIYETRRINLDFTVQFKNIWYQLTEVQPVTVRAKEKVVVETWLDGTIHFKLKEHVLNFTILPERPKREKVNPIILTTHKLNYKPSADHSWRKFNLAKA